MGFPLGGIHPGLQTLPTSSLARPRVGTPLHDLGKFFVPSLSRRGYHVIGGVWTLNVCRQSAEGKQACRRWFVLRITLFVCLNCRLWCGGAFDDDDGDDVAVGIEVLGVSRCIFGTLLLNSHCLGLQNQNQNRSLLSGRLN